MYLKKRLQTLFLSLAIFPAGGQISLVRELCEENYLDYATGLGYFIGFNDHLYFSTVDFCWSSGILRTDGTAAGTNKISGASFEWHPTARCISGGHLYYGGGNWLRRINGVTGDDEPVKEGLWHPRHMADLNGILIFSQNGTGLWRSDGTAEGTYQIGDVEGIAEIHSDGAYAYIGANHGIWRTNGTNTELLLSNTFAQNGTTINFYNPGITVWNDEVYFIHVGSGPDELGTNVDFFNLAKWSNGQVIYLTYFNGTSVAKNDFSLTTRFFPTENGLYFVSKTFKDGVLRHNQLWKTNGTAGGTYKVVQLSGEHAIPEYFHLNTTTIPPKNVKNIFFFPVGTNTSAAELWRSDGTSAGTFPVKTGIYSPREFGMVDGICYFIADDGIHGHEVWRSDGTVNGTYMVEDLYPGPGSGAVGENLANLEISASAFNGRYYFVGYTPETGNELFATGGSDPETLRVRFTDGLGWCAGCESDLFRIPDINDRHQYMIYTSGDALTTSAAKFDIHWNGSNWIGQHAVRNSGTGWVPHETSASNGLHTSPKPPCTGWSSGMLLTEGCATPVLSVATPSGAPAINTSAILTIGIINGKNAYELPLADAPQNQKVIISWNAALLRWEMVLEDPSARVSAGTILSVNTEDSGSNPPCYGWSGEYGLSGDICVSDEVLPVRLISFQALSEEDRTVRLTWKTASEDNFHYFGVERSADALNFDEISRVASAAAPGHNKSYIHIDSNPLAGRSYYRLRQVDLDGKKEFSQLVSVETPDAAAPYPNPAREGVFHIRTSSVQALRLTDINGRDIPYSWKALSGNTVEIRPGKALTPGIYLISVNGKGYKMLVE